MVNMSYESFDLPVLLKMDSLHTRRCAEKKPALTVDEYYGKLTAFLQLAPDVSRALVNFEKREADRDDRRCLDQMIDVLEEFACEAFVLESHAILSAYENEGNWRLAATRARQMKEDFDVFCKQLTDAKSRTNGVEAVLPDGAGDPNVDYGSMTLQETIKRMDEAKTTGKPVILAVDDSPAILQSVWAILNDTYQVLVLAKPTGIEDVLRKQKPDLFLLDYLMPEINGFELVPIIRGFEEHAETPIIFLTSDGSVDNVTSALALGALDFIVKPFLPDILREKIAKHIVVKS